MKRLLLALTMLFFAISPLTLSGATYRNFISHYVINGGNTLRVWIDSDTAFGEFASAELRWDDGMGGFNYSGVIDGNFDNSTEPGANWYVDIALPAGVNDADLQLVNKNEGGTYYGYTGFIHSLTALPVEIEKIVAESTKNGNILIFSTSTETNNSHFNIERSIDSRRWETLGQVAGAGTTQEQQEYSFLDKSPESGTNYYRIKQVDFDGTFSYSKIVSAVWGTKPKITTYPNPASEQLQIQGLGTVNNQAIQIEVINLQGQILLQQDWNQEAISVRQLPKGSYLIRVRSEDEVLAQERVIIQ